MDARADRLSRAVRDHPPVIGPAADHRCDAGAHSYLGDGRVVCWVVPSMAGPARAGGTTGDTAYGSSRRARSDDPPLAHAVDAELAAQPVPSSLASRWRGTAGADPDRFWELWCATEVLAKLADVPMVLLVRRGPVTASPVRWEHVDVHWLVQVVDDVVVAHGLAWATTPQVRPRSLQDA